MKNEHPSDFFRRFSHTIAEWTGHPTAFVLSLLLIIIWACFGPAADYSDTWQLTVNTSTTVITFLMVFLIQSTQNRDSRAIHLKLDELIRANSHARNHLIDLQNLSDQELNALHTDLCRIQKQTNDRLEQVQVHRRK